MIGAVLALPLAERVLVFRHEDADAGAAFMKPALVAACTGVAAAMLLACSVYVVSGTYNPFIYFRF